ncbi:MAG: hypothetical protein COV66_09920 [Nitrospinae bacterium CG11_big_fil_rev_8_21_14_0_20_45_15]|nr:MAG: hypothetical protein COV66_09920 [Nitrospinae bacterium CG11_big_fil_rev_8_21_14_0_20_45_15]
MYIRTGVQKTVFFSFPQVICQSKTFARDFSLGQSLYFQNLSQYFTELYRKRTFAKNCIISKSLIVNKAVRLYEKWSLQRFFLEKWVKDPLEMVGEIFIQGQKRP